jgi:hypothetical protein
LYLVIPREFGGAAEGKVNNVCNMNYQSKAYKTD